MNTAHDQRDHLETVAGGVLRDAWVDVLAAVEVLVVAVAKLARLFDALGKDEVHEFHLTRRNFLNER